MQIEQLSENSLLILFDQVISESQLIEVNLWASIIESELNDVLLELVPAAASIYISFNLLKIESEHLINRLADLTSQHSQPAEPDLQHNEARTHNIPVYYGIDVGFDLESLAAEKKICIEEIIHHHSKQQYRVYAMGFAPGFAYLGQVKPIIAAPRLETPRLSVPAGSVAIADRQTAIYPSQSPGGWRVIGRSPQKLFDPQSGELPQWRVGDTVSFHSIDKDTFIDLGGAL